jgi:GH24 family phage-related lysozyme (muramidase)
MASVLSRLFGLHKYDTTSRSDSPQVSNLPEPDSRSLPTSPAAEPATRTLPPLKNWCHPFKDKRDSLAQLTHMANANAGYYPIGRNGLFHGGVHFDSGTAGTLDQSSVHCLADGEVVAYRIDTQSPTTRYFVEETVEKPFSRNFVLVRHRLQPPKIDGSPDTPPSLTFYSLYMHLQDWAKYQQDSTLPRPSYWPERPTYRVKQTADDFLPGRPEQRGLKVYNQSKGQVIDFLPRGAEVAISGTGQFRKLERSLGPANLLNPDGSIKGYLSTQVLKHPDRKETRISSSKKLVNVRAEPVISADNVIFDLPVDSEVAVSGEGEFRKLERINQYVHFDSLESAIEPVATDQVVVLDQPVAIKAGDLIGHLGLYQDGGANQPDKRLHLETFSGDDVEVFIEASRLWAQRLPEKDRTWLKLAKGTPVVPPEGNTTAALLQASSASSPHSAADLLVPRKVLDELPTAQKIQVPASPTRKARTWYHLKNLLHDADNNFLDGWVCEEPGVTPWVSPWAWEGYDVIIDYSRPKHLLASFLRAVDGLSDAQRERYRPIAEKDDKGPMKSRLYEIIGRNPDGKITATELKAALERPAHAQSISQMILYKESEWFQQPKIWDALDELLGHSGSTPHLNWLAEKQRIAQLGWWGDVAEKVGLPSWGSAYHFHPIGLATRFNTECPKECVVETYTLEGLAGFLVVSKESFQFILEKEGYSKYPYVPAGASGVTIGYGYDLGQQSVLQVRQDLAQLYAQSDIEALIGAVGRQGDQARSILSSVSHISVSKENSIALAVRMKKRYAQLVIDAYPGVMDLHPHCQGALLSLVVNRGNSFSRPTTDSRLEMKQINDDLLSRTPEKIPSRLRSMKRLWEGKAGLGGLITRREDEAKLFERGLKCDCWH